MHQFSKGGAETPPFLIYKHIRAPRLGNEAVNARDVRHYRLRHRVLSGEKANISREVGGAFKAWGDHISGFNLALQPGQKIVQAWRAHDWWADHYSIAIFDLRKVDRGTELCFTQIGVPPHRFDGHSRGWIETYWRPMQDLFDKGAVSDQTRIASAAARQRIDQGDL
jgi:hypothetical protein